MRSVLDEFWLCYPDTRVLIYLPSWIPRTRVGFQVLFAVSPKILTNRTPAPESDTDTRTRVHVTVNADEIPELWDEVSIYRSFQFGVQHIE